MWSVGQWVGQALPFYAMLISSSLRVDGSQNLKKLMMTFMDNPFEPNAANSRARGSSETASPSMTGELSV